MKITLQNTERLTLEQIAEFVEGSRAIGFAAPKGQAVYEFIERVLKSQQYRRIDRGQKGIVESFSCKDDRIEPSAVDAIDRPLDEDQECSAQTGVPAEFSVQVHCRRYRPIGGRRRRA